MMGYGNTVFENDDESRVEKNGEDLFPLYCNVFKCIDYRKPGKRRSE